MSFARANRCSTLTFIFLSLLSVVSSKWFWESVEPNAQPTVSITWSTARKLTFREKVRDLWTHAFDNYMQHAYPMDELRPLSCIGRGPSDDSNDWVVNDVAGNFSVTLIDVLDTLVVLNDRRGFAQAVQNVINAVHSFDLNTRPQVFETNIRVLGGLLSAHQFASNPNHKFYLKWYKGELLRLAYDLGNRLLPAFDTPTGIPYARVNLRHGVLPEESARTCTAGAGSLILEFGVLSRLTDDPRFEEAAYKAFFAIWNRKSEIGLVGNTINAITGLWLSDITGIGAGVDSFYEYALKWYIMSGEVEFLDVWMEAYSNIMRYNRGEEGYWFRQVNMKTGTLAYASTDSLSSFWSGLQVLAGDVQNAIKSHLIYWNLWRRFSAIPEVFDLNTRLPSAWQYPLRPEFIESTYYLYRATRDSLYLDIGERVLNDILSRSKVDCGLASIENILTNQLDDRMESFVLSETLKYLYLLFDEENFLHLEDSNMVFSTEGHLLTLPRELIKKPAPVRRQLRRHENLQCPVYLPPRHPVDPLDETYGLAGSIRTRQDTEFARLTVGLDENSSASLDDSAYWLPEGWCELPKIDIYSFDFVLSPDGSYTPEDPTLSTKKIYEISDGYVILNMTGIRAHVTSRLDGRGYDITRLGPLAVRTGQIVYLNDSNLNVASSQDTGPLDRESTVRLRFEVEPLEEMSSLVAEDIEDLTVTGFTSLFGSDPYSNIHLNQQRGVPILQVDKNNSMGCLPYATEFSLNSMVLVNRGSCTFLQKLAMAEAAGAIGVVVVSDDEYPLNPTADQDELTEIGDNISSSTLLVIPSSNGVTLRNLISRAAQRDAGVLMWLEKADVSTSHIDPTERQRTGLRYLYPRMTKKLETGASNESSPVHRNYLNILKLPSHPYHRMIPRIQYILHMFGESDSESPRAGSPWDTFIANTATHSPNEISSILNDVPKLIPEVEYGNVEYKLKLLNPTPERFTRLVTQLKWRLLEGGGEAYYELGVADSGQLMGLSRSDLEASLETLEMMAGEIGASVIIVKEVKLPRRLSSGFETESVPGIPLSKSVSVDTDTEIMSVSRGITVRTDSDAADLCNEGGKDDQLYSSRLHNGVNAGQCAETSLVVVSRVFPSPDSFDSSEALTNYNIKICTVYKPRPYRSRSRPVASVKRDMVETNGVKVKTNKGVKYKLEGLRDNDGNRSRPALPSVSTQVDLQASVDDIATQLDALMLDNIGTPISDTVAPSWTGISEPHFIVEALILRKLAFEEAFLDFSGFALK